MNDGTVLLFSVDADQWGQDSRRIRIVRPDKNGRFQARGVPPGEYFATALEFVEDGAWNDPQFLESPVAVRKGSASLRMARSRSVWVSPPTEARRTPSVRI